MSQKKINQKLISSILAVAIFFSNFTYGMVPPQNYLRVPSNENAGQGKLAGELAKKSQTERPYKNESDPIYGKTLWKDEAGIYAFIKALAFDGKFKSNLKRLQEAEILTPEIIVEAIAFFVQFDKKINSKEDLDELFRLANIFTQQIKSLAHIENITYSYDDEFYFQALNWHLDQAVKLYAKEEYKKKIINSVQGKSIQAEIIQPEELNSPKTIPIGIEISEKTKNFLLNRKHELEYSLKSNNQKDFPELSQIDDKEIALTKQIFAKIIGDKNAAAAKNLKIILEESFDTERAESILNLVLEGEIDILNKIKYAERKKIYEAIFIKGKIWKSPTGKMDTLLNFITFNRGLREKYFGQPGGTEVEMYFGATNEEFTDIIIAQKERIFGKPLEPEIKEKIREEYSRGIAGGVNLPYQTMDGKIGSIVVINLGVHGFGKILSLVFHEMAHNLLIDTIATRSGKNTDWKFINEGIAEDFSIFALNALRDTYDGENAFIVLAARRQYRVLREKVILNDEYRYGFLLIETIRTRLGMNKFHNLMYEIVQVIKGKSSAMELSEIVDKEETKPSTADLEVGSLVDLNVTKAKTFEELYALINQTNLIPPENRKKLIDLIDAARNDKLDLPEDDDTGIIGLKAKVQKLKIEDFLKAIEKITFDQVAGEMKFVKPNKETIIEKIFFLDTMKEFKNIRKIKFTDYNLNPNIGILDTNIPVPIYTLFSEDGKFLGIQVGRENFPRSREKITKDVSEIIKSYADSIRKGEKTFINRGEDDVLIFINNLMIKGKEELLKTELTSSVMESHKTIDWVLEQLSREFGVSLEILKKAYSTALERSQKEREKSERQENSYFGPYLLKSDLDILVKQSNNLTENIVEPSKLWENEEGLHKFMQLLLSDKDTHEKHLNVLKKEKISYGDVIRAVGYLVQFNEANVTDKNIDKLFEQAGKLLSQINGLISVTKDHYGYLDKGEWIHGVRPLLDKLIKIYNSEENKQQLIARVKQAPIPIQIIKATPVDGRVEVFLNGLAVLKSKNFTVYHRALKLIGSAIGLRSVSGKHLLDIRGALSDVDEQRILNEVKFKLDQLVNTDKDKLTALIYEHKLNPIAYEPIINALWETKDKSKIISQEIKLPLMGWVDLYNDLFGAAIETMNSQGQSYVNGREDDIMNWEEARLAMSSVSWGKYKRGRIIQEAIGKGWLTSGGPFFFAGVTDKGWQEFFRRAKENQDKNKGLTGKNFAFVPSDPITLIAFLAITQIAPRVSTVVNNWLNRNSSNTGLPAMWQNFIPSINMDRIIADFEKSL